MIRSMKVSSVVDRVQIVAWDFEVEYDMFATLLNASPKHDQD